MPKALNLTDPFNQKYNTCVIDKKDAVELVQQFSIGLFDFPNRGQYEYYLDLSTGEIFGFHNLGNSGLMERAHLIHLYTLLPVNRGDFPDENFAQLDEDENPMFDEDENMLIDWEEVYHHFAWEAEEDYRENKLEEVLRAIDQFYDETQFENE